MLRLMIVDDEVIIRNALATLIDYEAIGYELVATAKNGMEAYDIICDEYLDVVITDIRMPGLSGLELIERARKTDPKLEFVILSGYGEFEYAKQAMKYGVKDYILKPTDKAQLIRVLEEIKYKKEKEMQTYLEERQKMLSTLKNPIASAFFMEGLQSVRIEEVFHKYRSLLSLANKESSVLFCYFVEENDRIRFVKEIGAIMRKLGVQMLFPAVAVTGSMVFITTFMSVAVQEKLKEEIYDGFFKEGIEGMMTEVMQDSKLEQLLAKVFQKISRYREITLIDENGESYKIQNVVNASWHLERMQEMVKEGGDISQIVESIFKENKLEINEWRNIAFDIYIYFHGEDDTASVEASCEFLRKCYACNQSEELCELLRTTLRDEVTTNRTKSNILLLKEYVNTHLDAEYLSLKWIAENYLFTNVQYLSKQFMKEEGERFSDYLTRQRMEEAKRLLNVYSGDNVKDIAKIVGFGNNPRYFSQVFKKYAGCTPSEYITK